MKRVVHVATSIAAICCSSLVIQPQCVSSFTTPAVASLPFRSRNPFRVNDSVVSLSAEAEQEQEEAKDFSKEASNLFSSVRFTSLFPLSATFGAAFAMPLHATDTILFALVKRYYLLLAISSLVSSLLAVIFSSVAINKIALDPHPEPTRSLSELLERDDFAFLWTGTNMHFYFSLLGFVGLVGMRSWASFGCPVFGRIGAMIVLSTLALMQSVISDGNDQNIFHLIARYIRLLSKRVAKGKVLTIISMGLHGAAFGMAISGANHVVHYMRRVGAM